MRSRAQRLIAACAVTVITAVVVMPAYAGEPPASGQLPDATQAALQSALETAWGGQLGGVVAGVWVPGKGAWTSTVGSATQEPVGKGKASTMSVDMQMPIGSITKTMTGLLVLQEIEKGTMSLDDPLATWFPKVPKAKEITVRMLLNMSSGIADYANTLGEKKIIPALEKNPAHVFNPETLIGWGTSLPRTFATPGKGFGYSTTNTVLLGRILEKVTGKPYEQLLNERLLKPKGLSHTKLDQTGQLTAPHPQLLSTQVKEGKVTKTTDWSMSWGWAGGGAATTLGDLATYGKVLGTGGGLLSPAMLALRIAKSECAKGAEDATTITQYCLGTGVMRDKATGEVLVITHNGGVLGGVAHVAYFPRTGAVVAVIANSDTDNGTGKDVATRVGAAIRTAEPALLGLPS